MYAYRKVDESRNLVGSGLQQGFAEAVGVPELLGVDVDGDGVKVGGEVRLALWLQDQVLALPQNIHLGVFP